MSKKTKDGNWFSRHKILTVILGLLLLVIIGSAAGGNSSTSSTTSKSNSTEKKESSATKTKEDIKIGSPARDGKFEFVVKSIQCGQASVGSSFTSKTAQGQFCSLNVSVKNIGNEPQSLFSENQYLFNASGQKYSADSTATMYAAPSNSSTWYSEINPGNSVEGAIVFDLPKDQVPTKAELHDSMASGGIKVSLQ